MKLERTKNATRNIIVGVISKIYQLIIPFIFRTALVYYLGIEYLGLNSLFSSVLSVLSLAELGVGSAMVFSMYKPIAEDDDEAICALMKLYRLYYRIIGGVILCFGLALTPAIPYFIKSDIPQEINIYVLYYINLFATVLSYWLFAYKNSILDAYQRIDITNKISMIISTITYIFQFIVLVVLRNYYIYILVSLIMQVIGNISTAVVASIKYPNYKPEGTISKEKIKEINGKVKDLFTAKVGGTIINSADSIVISAFLGLTVLAQYNNYFYIVSSIIGFISIIYNSCIAGIGNSLITESREKNYHDFEKILFIIMWIVSVCACCFANLFQPFIKIWMGEDNMLTYEIVLFMIGYFVVYEINAVLNLFKDAAGIWHQDRFRPLVVSLSNLILNIATVKWLGLYGVLLSTIVTMAFIGIPWIITNLFNNIFEKKELIKFTLDLIKKIIVLCLVVFFSIIVSRFVKYSGVLEIMIKLFISVLVPNTILILLNRKRTIYKEIVEMVRGIM